MGSRTCRLRELIVPPLAYWDPTAKQYGLAEGRAIPITVKLNPVMAIPGGPSPAALAGTNPPPVNPDSDLRPLKPDLGSWQTWSTPWLVQGWFWAVLASPSLGAGAWSLVGWWHRRPRDRSVETRSRRVGQVNSALQEMTVAANEGRADDCHLAAHRALQEQLGVLLGTTGGAYTEEIIDAVLIPKGLDLEAAEGLRDVFHSAARARFAGGESVSDLHRLSTEATRAVEALKNLGKGS